MRVVRLRPGSVSMGAGELVGAVLVRDLTIDTQRWSKGRRLSAADLACVSDPSARVDTGPRGREPGAAPGFTVLVLDEADVHEDDAAVRLATAVAGPGVRMRGPAESRVDLVAETAGVLAVNVAALERLNRIDPLETFTLLDGQSVKAGELVASVKIAPHVVAERVLARGITLAERSWPIARVSPFIPRRVAIIAKESVRPIAQERFESSVRGRIESLGSRVIGFEYVEDGVVPVLRALRALLPPNEPPRADVILTAGAASTDPTDPFFVAIRRLRGRVVRHGAPAHPGSMVWLARVGAVDVLGLPTCGAFSKATAADLLLPRLLTGERASAAMVARIGHGGVLVRAMRFRFPPYAQELEAPEP